MLAHRQTTFYNVVRSISNIEVLQRHPVTIPECSESNHTALGESWTDDVAEPKAPVSILITILL